MQSFFNQSLKNISFQPAMKWSGSKRSQCNEIIKYFPKEIDTYYEPFCGGCSMLYRLMVEPSIKVKRFIVSDINKDLILFWKTLKDDYKFLINGYTKLHNEFVELNQTEQKEYYKQVRERYNKNHNVVDFLFIMRTCYNGMPRYNSDGEFNNPVHPKRSGIEPDRLEKIFEDWSKLLKKKDVYFRDLPYWETTTDINDFVYLDPPYANTKGMYFGNFNTPRFLEFLKYLNCKWIMSYDGSVSSERTNEDYSDNVPKELYTEKIMIKSGNSSFRRLNGDTINNVDEALYIKR